MDIGTISSRYAKALFSLAKEGGQESRVYDDVKMLAESFTAEPSLVEVLSNPVVSEREKAALLKAAAGVEVCDLFERFIHLVLQHKRETVLPFISFSYINMYRKDKKITRVQFGTAVPVDEKTKEHLQRKLREETGCTIEFSGYIKPELIGGFRLRIGNYRIDASYATQLRDIRNRLLER